MSTRKKRQKNKSKSKNKENQHPLITTLDQMNNTQETTFSAEQRASQIDDDWNPIEAPSTPQQSPDSFHPRDSSEKRKNSSRKPREKSDWRWFWAGLLGAAFVILALVFISVLYPGHRVSRYYVNEDPSLLIGMLSTQLSPADSTMVASAIQDETMRRNDLIQDLLDQKVIVPSDEFASNLAGYYNTLIAVLAAILIIINLVGFFSWRSNANVSLEQKKGEMDDALKNIGNIMESSLEDIFQKNLVVNEKLEAMVRDLIEQGQQLDEEDWIKLHLFLKRFKREETLKEIEADEKTNDGQIGE